VSRNRPGVLKTFGRLKSLSPDSKPCHFQSRRRPTTAKSEPNWNERDMLIGAHARSEGLIVVTNNLREFERIPGLRIENWVQ
jgi:tRNA(fMet)-specific endonuclease VapC